MLIELIRGLWYVFFAARVRRTFAALLVFGLWLLLAAALFISIPHSYEVIVKNEHGDFAIPKSIALAVIVEMAAAVFFLLTLHSKEITGEEKRVVLWMTAPFIFITARLQLSYFYPHTDWVQITPFELGLILPYIITSVTVCIGIMWKYVSAAVTENAKPNGRGISFFGIQLWQSVDVTAYETQIRQLEEELNKTQAITAPDHEKEQLQQELAETQNVLAQWAVYREELERELAETCAKLEAPDASRLLLESELSENKILLANYQEELATSQKQLATYEETLATTKSELAHASTVLAGREEVLAKLQSELANQKVELAGREDALAKLQSELASVRQVLAEKEAVASNLPAPSRPAFPQEAVADILARLWIRSGERQLKKEGAMELLRLEWEAGS